MRFFIVFIGYAKHGCFINFIYSMITNSSNLTSPSDDYHIITFQKFDKTYAVERIERLGFWRRYSTTNDAMAVDGFAETTDTTVVYFDSAKKLTKFTMRIFMLGKICTRVKLMA